LSYITYAADNKNHTTQFTPASPSIIQKINVLPSGDIIVQANDKNNNERVSYFSSKPAQRTELAKHMLTILKSVKANASIIKFAEAKLHRHPALKNHNSMYR